MEEGFNKLSNLMSNKESISIEIDGVCDANGILEQQFTHTIQLKPNVTHQIALVRLETSSFFPNLTANNNKFYYSVRGSDEIHEITLQPGAYEIKQYAVEIKSGMIAKGTTQIT